MDVHSLLNEHIDCTLFSKHYGALENGKIDYGTLGKSVPQLQRYLDFLVRFYFASDVILPYLMGPKQEK